MCRFSIIVPFVQPLCSFDDTLASVLRYRPANSEVFVVHDGTYQDPHDLLDEVVMITAHDQIENSSCLDHFLSTAVDQAEGEITVWVRPGGRAGRGLGVPALGGIFQSDCCLRYTNHHRQKCVKANRRRWRRGWTNWKPEIQWRFAKSFQTPIQSKATGWPVELAGSLANQIAQVDPAFFRRYARCLP